MINSIDKVKLEVFLYIVFYFVPEQLQFFNKTSHFYCKTLYMMPTIVPVIQVAIVPATMDFIPKATISSLRSGTMVLIPPIRIPRLPGLANPHIA